ncbi:MAG: hypothetical protein EOO10_06065, partial [Chitinophagaceae bacterium]
MKIFVALFILGFNLSSFSQKIKPDTISIIGVGDIMLGTSYPKGYLPPNDGRNNLLAVEKILQNATLSFGNHEGTLFD